LDSFEKFSGASKSCWHPLINIVRMNVTPSTQPPVNAINIIDGPSGDFTSLKQTFANSYFGKVHSKSPPKIF